MSKPNEFPSSLSSTPPPISKPFSSSFKDKLRLPLPLVTPSADAPCFQPMLQSCKGDKSQSVLPAPCSVSSSEEDFPLTQSQEFKPSPRFNFSSSDSNSELVSNSDREEQPVDRLRIPNQYEFTLVRSRLEEQIVEKEKLAAEAKTSERRMEARLNECLQSTARAEGELRLCQQRNKALLVELETVKSLVATKDAELDKLVVRLGDREREVSDLQGELHRCLGVIKSLREQLDTVKGDSQVCKDQKSAATDTAQIVEKLKVENHRLLQANQQLITESNSKSQRVEKLQARLKRYKRKSQLSNEFTLQPLEDRSRSKENYISPKANGSVTSPQNAVMRLLKVEKAEDLMGRVEELRTKERQQKHSEEFVRKLQEIIIECSPPEAFKNQPSLSDMWRWVRRLVEEYMSLRKHPDTLHFLCSLLHTHEEELVPTLQTLIRNYEELLIGLSRMKAKLRLPLSADVKAVAQALESRLT